MLSVRGFLYTRRYVRIPPESGRLGPLLHCFSSTFCIRLEISKLLFILLKNVSIDHICTNYYSLLLYHIFKSLAEMLSKVIYYFTSIYLEAYIRGHPYRLPQKCDGG